MRNQKVGLTTTNWILSILGIIILSCFVVLPPVFRIFLKEDEGPMNEDVSGITTCHKEGIENVDTIDDEIISFSHRNRKLLNYQKITTRTYIDPMVYQALKPTYGQYTTSFNMITGYQYSIHLEDDHSSVQITERYDLSTFRPTTITVPGEENPTAITSTYQLNDDIDKWKEYLVTYGYVCSELDS